MSLLRIGTNILALSAQRSLNETNSKLGETFTRLSTGLRINKASDDAAGLAIAERLSADGKVYAQGRRNLQDGVSAVNIADAALEELNTVLTRIKELANQSANGSLSLSQRLALDEEASELSAEFNRIAASTEFNDRKLLDGSFGSSSVQVGTGTNGSIGFSVGEELERTVGDGTFTGVSCFDSGTGTLSVLDSGDYNGDGKLDIISTDASGNLDVRLQTGDQDFSSSTNPWGASTDINNAASLDIDNDGDLDLVVSFNSSASWTTDYLRVFENDGSGSFTQVRTINIIAGADLDVGDFDGDGLDDLVLIEDSNAGPAYDVNLIFFFNDGGNDFEFANEVANFGTSNTLEVATGGENIAVADIDGDGTDDVIIEEEGGTSVTAAIVDSNRNITSQTTSAVTSNDTSLGDINNDGLADLVYRAGNSVVGYRLGSGDGSFGAEQTFASTTTLGQLTLLDANNDGNLDIAELDTGVEVFLGDGDLNFTSQNSSGTAIGVLNLNIVDEIIADINGDGVLDILGGNTYVVGDATQSATVTRFNLTTASTAREALDEIEVYEQRLQEARSNTGSLLSRFEFTNNQLQSTVENFEAAAARIREADIALESANLVRQQILQDSAVAILAQANQVPDLVLSLLQPPEPPT